MFMEDVMKKLSAGPIAIFVPWLLRMSGAQGAVTFDHASLADVSSIRTDLGGGAWQYDVSITNNDTSNIWHFDFWTDATILSIFDEDFGDHVSINIDLDAASTFSEYDARNIDASVLYSHGLFTGGLPPSLSGLQVGETGTFSFTANFLITSFLYGYETGASGWTQSNGTGDHAAIGTTQVVPIPEAVWLFGSGLGLLGWMRRKAT